MIGVDLAAPAALRTTSGVPAEGTKHTKFVGHASAREVKTKLLPSVFERPFVRMWHRTDKAGGKWQNRLSQPTWKKKDKTFIHLVSLVIYIQLWSKKKKAQHR